MPSASPTRYRRSICLVAMGAVGALGWEFDRSYPIPTLAPIGEAGKTDTAYCFEAIKSGSPKSYARTNIAVRESGFGALLEDATDPTGNTFWALNDKGLATSYKSSTVEARVYPFPDYHQKLFHLRVVDNALVVLSVDSIGSLESAAKFTVGLPSNKLPADESALRQRLDFATIDETATLAAVANGYDFEALRRLPSGNFLVSDEFGPFLVEIDAATKRIVREWYPGKGLPNVFAKRRNNRGFEAMAVTPSGKVLSALQSPAHNPNSDTKSSRAIRMLWFDPADALSREYIYLSDLKGPSRRDGAEVKLGDMVALSETRFLVLEHGKDALDKYWIDLVEIDISEATNIHDPSDKNKGLTYSGLTPEQIGLDTSRAVWTAAGIVPVAKTVRWPDLLTGSTIWTSQKPEGMALLGDTVLVLLNDNDYGATDDNDDGIPHVLSASEQIESLAFLRLPSGTGVRPSRELPKSRVGVRRRGDLLEIATGTDLEASLQLRDPAGHVQATSSLSHGKGRLALRDVPPGLHFVEIKGIGIRTAVAVLITR